MTIVYTFTSLRSILQILVEKKIVTESHLVSFFNQRLENSTDSLSHDSGWFTIILLILTIIFMIIADYEIIKNQFYVWIPSKLKDEFLEN
jgi:predicted PurR-regulated permease PerM